MAHGKSPLCEHSGSHVVQGDYSQMRTRGGWICRNLEADWRSQGTSKELLQVSGKPHLQMSWPPIDQ